MFSSVHPRTVAQHCFAKFNCNRQSHRDSFYLLSAKPFVQPRNKRVSQSPKKQSPSRSRSASRSWFPPLSWLLLFFISRLGYPIKLALRCGIISSAGESQRTPFLWSQQPWRKPATCRVEHTMDNLMKFLQIMFLRIFIPVFMNFVGSWILKPSMLCLCCLLSCYH